MDPWCDLRGPFFCEEVMGRGGDEVVVDVVG